LPASADATLANKNPKNLVGDLAATCCFVNRWDAKAAERVSCWDSTIW